MAKHVQTPAAQEIYRELYASSPNAYLILTPDLKIIDGNDAFVTMMRINRDVFAGRYMFDAFPDNPAADPENTGVKNLKASFKRVLRSQGVDTLKCQRYDVQNQDGIWEHRRWNGTSWAITNDKESTIAVILHMDEVISNEIGHLLDEARVQLEKSKRLVDTGKQLADEAARLASETKQGRRLDQLKTLRELLEEFDNITIH